MAAIEKIYQFIEHLNISVNEFSLKIGVSNGYLAKQKAAKGSLGSNIIEKIVSVYPQLNANWLFSDSENMILLENEKGQKGNTLESQEEKRIGYKRQHFESVAKSVAKSVAYDQGQKGHTSEEDNYKIVSDSERALYQSVKSIPFYDINATAGLSPVFNGHYQEPDSYIIIPDAPRCDGAVRVNGDSMYPLVKSGDIVLFKRIEGIPQAIIWGEMYLVSLDVDGDEFVTVKLIQPGKGDEYIKLVSYNEFYQPKEIHLKTILGIAHIKAFIHYNTMK